MDYPYKATFTSLAKIVTQSEQDHWVAKASLLPLENILPKDIYPEDAPDVLYFAANGAVCGLCNKNGDALDVATALNVYSSAKNKYLSIDHDREKVIGAILYQGLSKLGTNEILTEEQAAESQEPFNMAVAGVIWKSISPMLTKYLVNIGDSTEDDALSLSWEIAYNKFDIGIGSKNVLKTERINKEDVRFASYEKLLRGNGGDGKKDGVDIYRIITGNPIILGFSVVPNPAGNVKGILPILPKKDENIQVEPNIDASLHRKIEKNEEKNITLINHCVNNNITKIMDIKSIQDIESKWDEVRKLESAASIVKFLADSIAQKSAEYVKQIEAKDSLVKTVEAQKVENEERASKLEESLAELEKEFEKVKQAAQAAELAQKFQERMASIDEEFDLDEDVRKIVAAEIKGLETDESFAGYMAKCKVMMKEKSKAAKKAKDAKDVKDSKKDKDDKKEDKKDKGKDEDDESDDEDDKKSKAEIKAALASVKEDDGQKIVNSPTIDKDLLDSLKNAFAGSIKVNGKTINEKK